MTDTKMYAAGILIAVDCIDMAYYDDTVSSTYPFELATMTIYGQVVRVADDCIAVAHQVHTDDGQVRHVSVIPRSAIIAARVLHSIAQEAQP